MAAEAHRVFKAWMWEHALPFWASAGRDVPGLGVREALTADGAPAPVAFKRMRVQARQIYAFSHAALLGWEDGEAVAHDAYAFINRAGRRPDGGWVRRLDPAGERVLDDTADLYDQAFVLFALAWYARLTRSAAAMEQARQTAAWLRGAMRGPGEGYLNTLPVEPGFRQQNPHMHLLEAALALFETSGDAYWAEWARELVALVRARLLDRATGTLGEFFTDDWSVAPGEAGDHIEPGHHYEWTWLLHQYTSLTGDDASAEAGLLYRFAEAHGCDPATGLVWDVVGRDGTARSCATRLWPQTEALKAHCVMARQGADVAAKIGGIVDNLMGRFFAECPAGAWRDRFDAAGRPAADGIPTSSFYHVFMGFAELDALSRGFAPNPTGA
jgi:mannose-6-phosphate isomerase